MAGKILKGEAEASEMNFETISEPGFYVNLAVAEQFGITIDEELLSTAVESFDSIGE